MHWPFPGVSKMKCEKLVRSIFINNNLKYNEIGIELTCYVLAVNIIRFRKGFRIEQKKVESVKSSPYVDNQLLSIILDTNNEFISTLVSELRSNYLLESTEIKFLLLWLYSDSSFYLASRDINNYLSNYSGTEENIARNSRYIKEISNNKKGDFRFDNLESTKKSFF